MSERTGRITENSDGSLSVLVDLQLFSQSTVKKAAYKFTGECTFSFEQVDEKTLAVTLTFANEKDKFGIASAFTNELIDQDLREKIARETETTRELILAHAFSKSGFAK